jgi:hypothetical protein
MHSEQVEVFLTYVLGALVVIATARELWVYYRSSDD